MQTNTSQTNSSNADNRTNRSGGRRPGERLPVSEKRIYEPRNTTLPTKGRPRKISSGNISEEVIQTNSNANNRTTNSNDDTPRNTNQANPPNIAATNANTSNTPEKTPTPAKEIIASDSPENDAPVLENDIPSLANASPNSAENVSETVFQTNSNTISPTEILPTETNSPSPDYWIYAALFAVAAAIFLASAWLAKKLFFDNANSLRSLKSAISVKEELAGKWLKKRKSKNIHAIGVGKIEGTDDYCIQVFVEDADGQMLEDPPTHLLPEKYQNFPIEIIEMPRAHSMTGAGENYLNRCREPHDTITGGISGANTNLAGEYGTIGYFCSPTILHPVRKFRREVYLLSNWHVFADPSKDGKTENDLIQQPSPGENKRHDFIASLENFVPVKFDNDTENPNFTDAAIAKLFRGKKYKLEIPHIGKITGFVPRDKIELRTKCRKTGRTTYNTVGEIFSIHLSIWIKYGAANRESFFKEQFLIVPNDGDFVRGGDSGALVTDFENKAVGLIFAGADSRTKLGLENLDFDAENLIPNNTKKIQSYGVANPISEVMKSLNVKLLI